MTQYRRTAKALLFNLCLAVPAAALADDTPAHHSGGLHGPAADTSAHTVQRNESALNFVQRNQSHVDLALGMHEPSPRTTPAMVEYVILMTHHKSDKTEPARVENKPSKPQRIGLLLPAVQKVRIAAPSAAPSTRVMAAQPATPPAPTGLLLPAVQKVR
ncbi:MAG: hypothetical protein QNJ92_02435 [Alphaproteobacteria bacterium]|nr:hypothetical protein [Alphaproteobacteria bacterium]